MKIENSTVLVTGGGSGIGLAIATELSENGAQVIICGRKKDKLDKAKEEFPALHIEICDVTNDKQIKALLSKMESEHGGIDLLINNAGVFENIDYRSEEQSLALQEREVNIDLMGPIRMVHHFLPHLKKRKTAGIVNVSSGLAFVPLAVAPVYSATKAGLHSWTRSLRFQLNESTVKVFELMPPLVKTEMTAQFGDQKMMEPKDLAASLVKGLRADKEEITPGPSSQLKMMSRWAPGFIFKVLNKQMS